MKTDDEFENISTTDSDENSDADDLNYVPPEKRTRRSEKYPQKNVQKYVKN